MHRRLFVRSAAGLLAAGPAVAEVRAAAPARRPVVLELFTSQGCSSCPPADALLLEVARDPATAVLPLAFHVTYWDRLGWRDPFSLPAATERQRRYAAVLGRDGVYTPQLVVDGRADVVGSDRQAVLRAVEAAAARRTTDVQVAVRREGAEAVVEIGDGAATSAAAAILVVGFDPLHETRVGHGENGGRTLREGNVVRGVERLGMWNAFPGVLRRPAPHGERLAVLLQAPNGRFLAAAVDPGAR